jgi:hypothetical protein
VRWLEVVAGAENDVSFNWDGPFSDRVGEVYTNSYQAASVRPQSAATLTMHANKNPALGRRGR